MRETQRIFLLSPARLGGPRSNMLFREAASFDLTVRLRAGRATLSEVYSFISGLYFRGKMEYARVFGTAFIITPGWGLVSPDRLVTIEELRLLESIPIESSNAAFREPLVATSKDLVARAGSRCEFVLLGSIATDKYTGPLKEAMGEKLLFPSDFVGRGDMSRGGLMLRSARSGNELSYVGIDGVPKRGSRPAKLEKLPRGPTPPLKNGSD